MFEGEIRMSAPVRHEFRLSVERSFEPIAAELLSERILALPRPARALVDFSLCQECHPFALAAFARRLADQATLEVEIRGLAKHHRTLLRYLGLPLAAESMDDGFAETIHP
jgi:hypothetical protein